MMLLKRNTNVRAWLVPLLALGLAATEAKAAVVSYDFMGEQNGGPGVVMGSFSYDTNQVDQDPLPNIGVYSGSFEVSITGGPQDGGFQSATDADFQFGGGLGLVIFPPSVDPLAHFFQILDPNYTTELTPVLDTSVYSAAAFLNSALGLPPGADFDLQIGYTMTSLELRDPPIAPVPLPAGLPMLFAGLGLLACFKGKPRSSAGQIPV